jgi:hypothetical protein
MRLIRRAEWLATFPAGATDSQGRPLGRFLGTSPAVDGPALKGTTTHWAGGNVRDFSQRDPFGYVRNIHAQHRERRNSAGKVTGWDISYNWVIPFGWDGLVFEARGLDIRSAAQGDPSDPEDENRENLAIQLGCDLERPGEPLVQTSPTGTRGQITQAQVDVFREVVTMVRARFPHATRMSTHRRVDAGTSCPGDKLDAATMAGLFEPTTEEEELTEEDWTRLRKIVLEEIERAWAKGVTPSLTRHGTLAAVYNGQKDQATKQQITEAGAAIVDAIEGIEPVAQVEAAVEAVIERGVTRTTFPAAAS